MFYFDNYNIVLVVGLQKFDFISLKIKNTNNVNSEMVYCSQQHFFMNLNFRFEWLFGE